MPFVVDASITASWAFEEHHADADRAFQALAADTVLAPRLWWFEIRNLLLMDERRKKRRAADTEAFLRILDRLPIAMDDSPDEKEVFALARKHRLTIYDAAYLELAQRRRIPLSTLDGELIRAAKAEKIPLF
jgi:predicted nucleic acid-binding protein